MTGRRWGRSSSWFSSIVPAVRLEYQVALVQRGSEQQVLSGNVSGGVDQLRDMAHYISDQSFEKLTGIKGAAGSSLFDAAERFAVDNTRYAQRADYDGARAVTLLQSREPILSPALRPGRQARYLCISFEQKRPRIFHPVRRH